jgi:DNA polymerase
MLNDVSTTPTSPTTPLPVPERYAHLSGLRVLTNTEVEPPPFVYDGDLPTYAIDFETYYDKECSVKTLGNYHYCRHPLFEAYMVSIYGPGVSYVGCPRTAPWHLIKGAGFRWISHNASFDEEVQLFLVERGIVPPDALPEEWHCTSDLAAYFGAPRSLAGALKWFFNEEISKEARNKMLGKQWSSLNEEEQLGMLKYAMDDSIFARDKLWQVMGKGWPAHERRLSVLTRRMGRRGVCLDVPKLESGIQTLRGVRETSRAVIPWSPTDPEDEKGILSHPKLRAYCTEQGIEAPLSLAKDSPECAEWEEKYGNDYPVVGAMRDYRRSNALLKKLLVMQSRLKPDGRMTFSLKYFGANVTGRWSGDGGWNSQNQNRDAVFGVEPRKLIIPGPGQEFLISDSSQIEPRCLAWLSGNWAFIAKVNEGFGIYEAFAVAKGKWLAEKKGRLKKEDPETYKWAKAAVLGLGFGCGKAKFVEVARILAGMEITLEESTAIVDDFRRTELCLTGDGRDGRPMGLWRKLENAMSCHVGRDFAIQLPTGRKLRYRDVQAEDAGGISAVVTKNIHGAEKTLRIRYWGGILTENITQATAREVFASILLRLDAAGIEVVMHIHDEVVCEVPTAHLSVEEREAVKAKVEAIMCATPSFIKGTPLGCESMFTNFYMK